MNKKTLIKKAILLLNKYQDNCDEQTINVLTSVINWDELNMQYNGMIICYKYEKYDDVIITLNNINNKFKNQAENQDLFKIDITAMANTMQKRIDIFKNNKTLKNNIQRHITGIKKMLLTIK